MNELHAKILLKIKKHPAWSTYELAADLDLSITHIYNNLRVMCAKKYLSKVGNRRSGFRYAINTDESVQTAIEVLNGEDAC